MTHLTIEGDGCSFLVNGTSHLGKYFVFVFHTRLRPIILPTTSVELASGYRAQKKPTRISEGTIHKERKVTYQMSLEITQSIALSNPSPVIPDTEHTK